MEDKDNWLKREIAQGFMMLAALNLKGRPASADLTAVAKLWHGILGSRIWQPERDTARIKAAFLTIAATSSEWPNPSDLIRHLPPEDVRMVPRLEKKHRPTEYTKDANVNLKAIVQKAFNVNAEGKINVKRVLELRTLKIEDEKWQRAMQALSDSLHIQTSREYIRFYERKDDTGEYELINLDFAKV